MRYGYIYARVLFDETGRAVDFIHEEVNESYSRLTGLRGIIGKKATEVFPDLKRNNPDFLARHLRVAETGISDSLELYLEALDRWYDISIFSTDTDHFTAIIDDITARKVSEEGLRQSEQRFRTLFENHSACMMLLDAHSGEIIDTNEAAADFYGWSVDELRKMNILDIATVSADQINSNLRKMRTDRQKRFSFVHHLKNGGLRDVELFTSLINMNGRDVLYHIIHDNTEQVRLQAVSAMRIELLEMSSFSSAGVMLRAVLDRACRLTASPSGFVFFVTGDQRTLSLEACKNEGTKTTCNGQKHPSLFEKGSPWADVIRTGKPAIHNGQAAFMHCCRNNAESSQDNSELVVPVIRDNATVAILGIGGKAVDYVDKDIELLETLTNQAWDIIAKKIAEESRNLLHQKLQVSSKMELVGQLAAGIAHEINNPLNFILANEQNLENNFSELLSVIDTYRDGRDPLVGADREAGLLSGEDLDSLIGTIHASLEKTRTGVARIKEISQSMQKHAYRNASGNFSPFDINKAIEEIVVITKNECRSVAEISLDLAPLPPVPCDPSQINQVLLNLVMNSIHAIRTMARKEVGTITISTGCNNKAVSCSVQDDGPGIPEKLRERVFEPFFTTKEMGAGTGLGLSICHDIIVNRHRGNIRVVCPQKGGSVFTFSLPLKGAH
ncbi:ATP-binding protein [Pelodictyon luteolum]|nr:ATP-binding protein [Pelodictyon luteolum]